MRNILLLLALATSACGARAQLSPTECQHAMSMFASGKSMNQIAFELHLESRADARALVHDAMIDMSRRYYRDNQ
jgi:hypothetical protein